MRDIKQTRSVQTELQTRAEPESQDMYIEGYFAVFNRQTELWPGAFEEIAPGAFDSTLGNDIRALINHDTTLVLGRNKSGTLELKADSHGLWGQVKINPNDSDAVFQPTHPHGVRQLVRCVSDHPHGFQPTHPHGVRLYAYSSDVQADNQFQPTHPHGVRLSISA